MQETPKNQSSDKETEQKNVTENEDGIFSADWFKSLVTLKEEDRREQVNNYNTLSVWKSYRKLSAILILIAVAISMYFGFYISALPALILTYFVYRGKKWALILMILLWTIERVYALGTLEVDPSSNSLLWIFAWWIFYVSIFWKAFLVEQARSKSLNR